MHEDRIEQLARHCLVEVAWLDREVARTSFYDISKCLSQWRLLAHRVNISPAEVEAIESDHQGAEMQRIGFLGKWKQKMSIRATYRALIASLLSIERAEDARCVCQVLKGKGLNLVVIKPKTRLLVLDSVLAVTSSARLERGQVEGNISSLETRFHSLVQSIENSFLDRVRVEDIILSIKCIPLTIRWQLNDNFSNQASNLLNANRIEEVFIRLSEFWDLFYPGLLNFLVEQFGSHGDKRLMREYCEALKLFRSRVTIGDFLNANHTTATSHILYQYRAITTHMRSDSG